MNTKVKDLRSEFIITTTTAADAAAAATTRPTTPCLKKTRQLWQAVVSTSMANFGNFRSTASGHFQKKDWNEPVV